MERISTVTTLAIRGTAEERMVTRREDFKGSRDKIPKLIEEAGMRHFIAVSEHAASGLLPTNRMVRIRNSLRLGRSCLPAWMSRLSNSMHWPHPTALKNTPQNQLTIPQDRQNEFGSLALSRRIMMLFVPSRLFPSWSIQWFPDPPQIPTILETIHTLKVNLSHL